MRLIKQISASIRNLSTAQFLFIPEHQYRSIFRISYKTCLVFLSICLLSLGGIFKTLFFLTNQANSYITVNFQLKKNYHYKSLADALNHLLDRSISLIHFLPCSTVVIPKNLTIVPDFVSNSSLFPLMTPNSIEQLVKTYDFKYNLQPLTSVRRNITSDLLVFG